MPEDARSRAERRREPHRRAVRVEHRDVSGAGRPCARPRRAVRDGERGSERGSSADPGRPDRAIDAASPRHDRAARGSGVVGTLMSRTCLRAGGAPGRGSSQVVGDLGHERRASGRRHAAPAARARVGGVGHPRCPVHPPAGSRWRIGTGSRAGTPAPRWPRRDGPRAQRRNEQPCPRQRAAALVRLPKSGMGPARRPRPRRRGRPGSMRPRVDLHLVHVSCGRRGREEAVDDGRRRAGSCRSTTAPVLSGAFVTNSEDRGEAASTGAALPNGPRARFRRVSVARCDRPRIGRSVDRAGRTAGRHAPRPTVERAGAAACRAGVLLTAAGQAGRRDGHREGAAVAAGLAQEAR